MEKPSYSRRDFMKSTAAQAASAGAVVGVIAAGAVQTAAAKASAANSALRVAFWGTGARGQNHIDSVLKLKSQGRNLEAVAVCDVFAKHRENAAQRIQKLGGQPLVTGDYRELLDRHDIDVVVVSTPDHWHARMTLDALAAGKHVYCEKPMTHTLEESQQVLAAWRKSGRVMQVGCQRTSDGRWQAAYEYLCAGHLGKVVQAQTEYFRNSGVGQWRSIGLSRDMTPSHIDWPMFLGTEYGLSPEMPFDRALFAQWRCYWPFSSGIFSELFVHRLTELLLATGLRYPKRVTSGGGIFMEYDGRDVPDTATLIADYAEGCQLVVSSTLCNDHPFDVCLRGHYGTLRFDLSKDGFDFLPQRPQVTRMRDLRPEHISVAKPQDETLAHWENFLQAIHSNKPSLCHNTPELGAAAVVTTALGAASYRQGVVWQWDSATQQPVLSNPGFAQTWESLSQAQAPPTHPTGWQPSPTHRSQQRPPDYQKLAGPWQNNTDPAG